MVTSTERMEGMGMELGESGMAESVARAVPKPTGSTSDLLLLAAGASVLTSLSLKIAGQDHKALFVGQWAPTLVGLACFVKLAEKRLL